jgi:predicted DNA-binding protein
MQQKFNEAISLRLPAPLREQIEQQAAAESRTLANMTRRILEGWAAARESTGSAGAVWVR